MNQTLRAVAHRRPSSAALPPALVAAVLVVGCATTPPSTFYTLTPIPEARARTAALSAEGPAIGLGPVTFPSFLDRPQVVSRAAGNRLELDELRRWGGTLQDDFLRVLGENLAHLLGTSAIRVYPADARLPLDLRVQADVLSFEGSDTGEAVLKVRWSVVDPAADRVLLARESTYAQPVAGDDTDALIAAQSAALGAFSREVAERLGGLRYRSEP